MQLKLADFGLATKIEFQGDRKHTVCGTPNYIAPEVIRSSMGMGHSGHSYEVDVWSAGVILYIMLVGRAPFETTKVERTYQKISKGEFGFPESFKDESAKDLLRKVLVVDISKRYTFDQILAHPFMNPKQGIPKEIPHSSMVSMPKFGVFQKYAQEDIKQSAREASIQTLRSSIDVTLDQDFGPDSSNVSQTDRDGKETDRIKSKSKEVRSLLRSVLSTSSLHKSLEKLNNLSFSSSQQIKNGKFQQSPSMIESTSSGTKSKLPISSFNALSNRMNTTEQISEYRTRTQFNEFSMYSQSGNGVSGIQPDTTGTQRHSNHHIQYQMPTIQTERSAEKEKKLPGPVFILNYNKDVVWSYLLNNGNVGTYESGSHYKVLYNKADKIYFEVINDGAVKKIKAESVALNENIGNRQKFIDFFAGAEVYCEHSLSNQKLIYLRRVFEALNYETNHALIITSEDLLLVQIKGGKQISRLVQKKQKYMECKSKLLLEMYSKVKKILRKIQNAGKG